MSNEVEKSAAPADPFTATADPTKTETTDTPSRPSRRMLRERQRLAPTWVKAAILAYYVACTTLIVLAAREVLGLGADAVLPSALDAPAEPRRLAWPVVLAGALGGVLHGLASLEVHSGRRQLHLSWWVFYVARPFVGAGMAMCVFLIFVGGIAGISWDPQKPWVAVAWAAMAGLFSSPALRKLRDIFEAAFSASQQSKNEAKERKSTLPEREVHEDAPVEAPAGAPAAAAAASHPSKPAQPTR